MPLAALLALLWMASFTPPVASAEHDACTDDHTFFLTTTNSVNSGSDSVDYWTGSNALGLHHWIVQTHASGALGDSIHLTVYSGSCSNSGIVHCPVDSASTTVAYCSAQGPTWARVWYRGDGGTTQYTITHFVT